jgi:ATP-dependent DNA ligase
MRTGIMLCYPFEEKRLTKWNHQFLIQPKLDGDRCRAIFDEYGKVKLLSSEENQFNSVPHIVDQLENMGLKSIELDGELYTHGVNHQTIHGAIARTVNLHPEFEQVEYHIFDYVSNDCQIIRSVDLPKIVTPTDNVKLVETQYGETVEDVMHGLEYYTELGYEGVVLRNINYPYIRKRSTGMMKFKPRKEDIYTVVGFEEEISIHGEPKQSLGALWLSSGEGERFKVGSGSFLTRENREALWIRRNSLLGELARVKYQHLTERRVPRFPVLVDIIKVL